MDLLKEIEQEYLKGNLSVDQFRIFNDYINKKSFDQLKKKYHISCNNVIVRIVARTIQLQRWTYHMVGGNDSYLNNRDLNKFNKTILDYAEDINCITASTALQLARDLHTARYKKAVLFLNSINKINLISHIKLKNGPSKEYIYEIIKKLDLNIVSAQTLEFGRRFFCDFDTSVKYFTVYGQLFQRDCHLILNMDETSLSSKKRLKVISKTHHLPLLVEQPKIPHITGCITVSASGHYFTPMIIVPNKKKNSYIRRI